MLHRAHVITPPGVEPDEVIVFFEVAPGQPVYQALRQVVAAAWTIDPEAVEFYNCFSHTELSELWQWGDGQRGAEGDRCLLWVGDGPDGPIYAQPGRTQTLTSLRWQQRLAAAQVAAREDAVKRASLALRSALASYHAHGPHAGPAAPVPGMGQPVIRRQGRVVWA